MTAKRHTEKSILSAAALRRAAAFFAVLIMLFSAIPLTAFATEVHSEDVVPTDEPASYFKPKKSTESGTKMYNSYLLVIRTGTVPGDRVKYIKVRYKDKGGVERSQFIFPNDNGLNESRDMITRYGDGGARKTSFYNSTHYVPCGEVYNKTQIKTSGLEKNSTDSYLFKPDYEFSKLIGINIFMEYSSNLPSGSKNEWTLYDMRLYWVDKIYGEKMYGYVSDKNFTDFSGTLLARLVNPTGNAALDLAPSFTSYNYRFGSADEVKAHTCDYELDFTEEKYDSNGGSEFVFRLDIADTVGAGIEALVNEYADNKSVLSKMGLPECLYLHLIYTDIYDKQVEVTLPVITSVVGWLCETYAEFETTPVLGVAQQGDTIVFKGYLPDFMTLDKMELSFRPNSPGNDSIDCPGINAWSEYSKYNRRLGALKASPTNGNNPESMSFTSISLFNATNTKVNVTVDGSMLKCLTSGTPVYYYTTKLYVGQDLSYGSSPADVSSLMVKSDGSYVTLKPQGSPWKYVVEVTTDTNPGADTKEDIYMRFRYLSKSGAEKVGDVVNLNTATTEFLGYWPSRGGSCAYSLGTRKGGKLIFGLSYSDVDYFIGVTVYMNEKAADDWQMSQIKIYRVNYVSERMGTWDELVLDESAGSMSMCTISRDFDRDYCVRTYDKEKVLIYKNEYSKYIEFDETGGSVKKEHIDWNKYADTMTYEETHTDFRFTEAECTYTVKVKVEGNSGVSGDDDYGSKNKFYFRLIFENGSSGYVLANQQLSADGFRAGVEEQFTIKTNRDYGNLSAIRIIPDDTKDNTDAFDKLNVRSITVTNTSDMGVMRTWSFDSVGWIKIDYKDEGAKDSGFGQGMRREDEIANNRIVTSTGYMIDFLVALKTNSVTNLPFDAKITLNVDYLTRESTRETAKFDLLEELYKYMGLSAPSDGQFDPNMVLREGHVDRFDIGLKNVSQIISMNIVVNSKKQMTWNIGDVDIYQITSKGLMQLNDVGEYQRADTFEPLCGRRDQGGINVDITNGVSTKQIFFEDAIINVDDNGTWKTNTSKNPNSLDDSLNLYIYMSSNAASMDQYDMVATIEYLNRSEDSLYQLCAKNMGKSTEGGQQMYYVSGLSAKGLSALYRLTLKANSTKNVKAAVDHAIIQHIRNGVLMNTYEFNFGGGDVCFSKMSCSPKSLAEGNNEKQVITLKFGDDTRFATLEPEIRDVVVYLQYSTNNGTGSGYYTSGKITLASQLVDSISSGKTVSVTFNEPNVGRINAVYVQSVGDITASVECACAGVYVTDKNQTVRCRDWWNFAPSVGKKALSYEPIALNEIMRSYVPVTLRFITGGMGVLNTPIRMVLGVTYPDGTLQDIVYEDITSLITSGGFMAGETARVDLMLTDISKIRSIELCPYDNDDTNLVSLSLTNVVASWTIDGTETAVSRAINENADGRFYEAADNKRINLCDVLVSLDAAIMDKTGVSRYGKTIRNSSDRLTIESGESVRVYVDLVGGLDGFGYQEKVEMSENGTYIGASCYTKTGNTLMINPPENTTAQSRIYQVTVTSDEVPSSSSVLMVEVLPAPAPETPPAPDVSGSDA